MEQDSLRQHDEDLEKILSTVKHVPGRDGQERPSERNAGKKDKKEKLPSVILICASVVIACVVFLAAFLIIYGRKDDLAGKWSPDNVTVYSFNGRGRGEMVLPLNTYDFRYVLEDGMIRIDFADESVEDREYIYVISDGVLKLTGNDGMEFRFTRMP